MPDMIRKTVSVEVKDLGDRVLEFLGSTETPDRDAEVIRTDGWDLKSYKKNPVFMWAHDYSAPPIGRALDVRKTKDGLTFKIEFADRDTYEFADIIYRLYKGGFLHATSVGFIPKEWQDGDGEKAPRRTFTKQELLELSAVPVPSNPNALITARDAGVITVKEFEAVTKPEVTDEYIRIPVKGEEGKHDDHRIRTIDISKEQGIKALYCGECKKVITVLFDREKWTVTEANEWMREHDYKDFQPADVKPAELSQEQIADEIDYARSLVATGRLTETTTLAAWGFVEETLRITGSDMPEEIRLELCGMLGQPEKESEPAASETLEQPHTPPSREEIAVVVAQSVARLVGKK